MENRQGGGSGGPGLGSPALLAHDKNAKCGNEHFYRQDPTIKLGLTSTDQIRMISSTYTFTKVGGH